MDIRLLGPVTAEHDGRTVPLAERRQRLMLAVLALECNRWVPVTRLLGLCWPADPPRTAVHAIHVAVSGLRSAVARAGVDPGQFSVVREADAYSLRADPSCVDVHRFRRHLADAAAATDDTVRLAALTEALELWTGEPFVDAAPPATRQLLGQGLVEARLGAVEDRFETLLRLGRHRPVLDELAAVADAHPWRERLVELRMTALHRGGQPAEALRVYREARHRLAEDLGLDPGARLRDLESAILRDDPGLGSLPSADHASAAVSVPAISELPPDVFGFTGRRRELARLDRVLAGSAGTGAAPVALLCGTAGGGKTALAVHWAHRVAGRFPDGQLYLDLRGHHPRRPVPAGQALATLLGSLGVAGHQLPGDLAGRVNRYRSLLAGRRMVVVLDNAASAEQVRPLLPGTPTCLVVVTSRDSLTGLVARDGARRVPVPPLPLAGAMALLRSLCDLRQTSEREVAALADGCARLPLALRIAAELLAAQPHKTAADLSAALADERSRLSLLDAGADPHTSIRAVFSWSERHLDRPTTRLFRLLGVYPGRDIDDAAAAALAGLPVAEVRERLDTLARASLVEPAGAGWAMHDLLRAHAGEGAARCIPTDEVRRALTRVLDHNLDRCRVAMNLAFPGSAGPPDTMLAIPVPDGPAEARQWLDAQRSNLIACATYAADNGWPGQAIRYATALAGYLYTGYHNADAFLLNERALVAAVNRGDRLAHAHVVYELGRTHGRAGHMGPAVDCMQRSLAIYRGLDDPSGQALCRHCLGTAHMFRGEYAEMRRQYRKALALFRAVGDGDGQARTLNNLARVDYWQGRDRSALERYRQAQQIFDRLGAAVPLIKVMDGIGQIFERRGDYDEAYRFYQRASAFAQRAGDRYGLAAAGTGIGRIRLANGHPEEALRLHRQALRMYWEIGARFDEVEVTIDIGDVIGRLFEPRHALAHYRRAYRVARSIGEPRMQARALDAYAHAAEASGGADRARRVWRLALRLYRRLRMPQAGSVQRRLDAGG